MELASRQWILAVQGNRISRSVRKIRKTFAPPQPLLPRFTRDRLCVVGLLSRWYVEADITAAKRDPFILTRRASFCSTSRGSFFRGTVCVARYLRFSIQRTRYWFIIIQIHRVSWQELLSKMFRCLDDFLFFFFNEILRWLSNVLFLMVCNLEITNKLQLVDKKTD